MLGWPTAVKFNTGVVTTVSVALLSSLIAATDRAGGIQKPLTLYTGSCEEDVSRMNVGLHLLLNVISTAVLASSNFFMQILNAPSRSELDKAHSRGVWMAIGVSSVHNIFRVSWWKSFLWLGFFITSVPVHFLFNSIIFEIDNRVSQYDLTIAAASFTQGNPFFPPGASLITAGDNYLGDTSYNSTATQISNTTKLSDMVGYGDILNPLEYKNISSGISSKISGIVKDSAKWDMLEAQPCMDEFTTCGGLRRHRDVVVIVQGKGWTPSSVWNLSNEELVFWDDFMPRDHLNSLWYHGSCRMFQLVPGSREVCENSCNETLSRHTKDGQWFIIPNPSPVHPLYGKSPAPLEHENTYNKLNVSYCLAKRIDAECKVVLSTALLLSVTLSIITKAFLCGLTLFTLDPAHSLVTPGDVLESYICIPCTRTLGLCNAGLDELRMRVMVPGPRRWVSSPFRNYAELVPKSVWALALILLGVLMSFFAPIASRTPTGDSPETLMSGLPLYHAILLANSPHLLLSLCYLAFNNILTRFAAGREWALMSRNYHGLRVTKPKGRQTSTYRLQLPYLFSIPLITYNVLLHWNLSNTIYTTISTGDYFIGRLSSISDNNLPPQTNVSINYSATSFGILLGFAVPLFILPLVSTLWKLRGNSLPVGINSLAFSAACHISPLAKPDASQSPSVPAVEDIEPDRNNIRLAQDKGLNSSDTDDISTKTTLEKISQSKLKWGVVEMPPTWHQEYASFGRPVGHISLGTTQDKIELPLAGHWYA